MNDVLSRALADEKSRRGPKQTVCFGLRLDDETHDKLTAIARRENVPINGLILAILRRALVTEARAG